MLVGITDNLPGRLKRAAREAASRSEQDHQLRLARTRYREPGGRRGRGTEPPAVRCTRSIPHGIRLQRHRSAQGRQEVHRTVVRLASSQADHPPPRRAAPGWGEACLRRSEGFGAERGTQARRPGGAADGSLLPRTHCTMVQRQAPECRARGRGSRIGRSDHQRNRRPREQRQRWRRGSPRT